MAMESDEIISMIETALPGSKVSLEDLAGDGDHYAAHVVWDGFSGMTRVKQHQTVYNALEGKMGGVLHALALKTSVPA